MERVNDEKGNFIANVAHGDSKADALDRLGRGEGALLTQAGLGLRSIDVILQGAGPFLFKALGVPTRYTDDNFFSASFLGDLNQVFRFGNPGKAPNIGFAKWLANLDRWALRALRPKQVNLHSN